MSAIEQLKVGPVDALTMSTDQLTVTVLTGKGADILSMEYRSTAVDPLWKARWGGGSSSGGRLATSSYEAWFAACQGGWFLLVPNAGEESTVDGVTHPWHGESSMMAFEVASSTVSEASVSLCLVAHLHLSPLRVARRLEVLNDRPVMLVTTTVTNEGGEDIPLIAVEHPTFGRPFISSGTTISTGAGTFETDEDFKGAYSPYPPGAMQRWPGEGVDLSRAPGLEERRQLLACLGGFDTTAWSCVRSPVTGMFFGLAWSSETFPYAWFFQEMNGSSGYPWFSNSYLMAIEPATVKWARGLGEAVKKGSAIVLAPGENWRSTVVCCLGVLGQEEQLMAALRRLVDAKGDSSKAL